MPKSSTMVGGLKHKYVKPGDRHGLPDRVGDHRRAPHRGHPAHPLSPERLLPLQTVLRKAGRQLEELKDSSQDLFSLTKNATWKHFTLCIQIKGKISSF